MRALRILCFNIHGGRNLGGQRDLGRLRDLMDRLDIDIGVFQEMETRVSMKGTQSDVVTLAGPDRPHSLVGASIQDESGWYGNLIVSRHPILRGLVHNLETKVEYEPRCAVDALIDSPLGKIRIIGTHLSLAAWERYSEARNLTRLMDRVEETERNPVLLMGDLNEWREKSHLIRHLNGLMTPVRCGPTFPSRLPVLKLDRLWHDAKNLSITAKRLTGKNVRRLSDHLPLMIEIAKA